MPTPPPLNYQAPPQFSPEHLQQIEETRAKISKIKKACLLANIDGGCILVFGVLSSVCGFSDFVGFIVGILLIAIGALELKFASDLKRLEKNAAIRLAINQCALSLFIILYAIRQMTAPLPSSVQSQLSGLGAKDIENMLQNVSRLFYTVLIFIALFLWGGQAYYYYTREKIARAIASETPPWILQLIRQKVI